MPAQQATPGTARRAWNAWLRAGEKAAHILGIVIFTILWFVAFGPISLWLKLRGKRLLPHFTGQEETYYLPKDPIPPTLEQMKRQW
jgi:hypothetical protein